MLGRVAPGVGKCRGVGRVEAGGEAVDLVACARDLGELPGEFLDLGPEVPHLLNRNACVRACTAAGQQRGPARTRQPLSPGR